MRQQYGDDVAEALFEGLSQEPSVSIRLNPWKKTPQPLHFETSQKLGGDGMMQPNGELCIMNCALSPVAWCPDAYYLSERPNFTADPLLHAGVYYVQEAGSMYLAEMLRKYIQPPQPPRGSKIAGAAELTSPCVQPAYSPSGAGGAVAGKPLVALDLCAAPGGKSTLLRSLLPEGSLLVSNEPMPKRAQVLAENIIKWGHPACVVTRNYPADFSPFVEQFDLIVTDVPCSGEGMFRKDEGAIRDWSLENVDTCWRRQRSILSDIWPCLKPGGLLIYSTCTFNRFEDEDNVAWIAKELGAEVLEDRHFLPGRDKGEGFYIAALRKTPQTKTQTPHPPVGGDIPRELMQNASLKNGVRPHFAPNPCTCSQPSSVMSPPKGGWGVLELKDKVVLYPAAHAALMQKMERSLHCLVSGVVMKEKGVKDWVPSHQYAMSLAYERGCYPEYELSREEAIAYLRREALRIDAPKGYVLVTYQGVPLGFVKSVGNRANNLYPQEWRIRSTYV